MQGAVKSGRSFLADKSCCVPIIRIDQPLDFLQGGMDIVNACRAYNLVRICKMQPLVIMFQ